MKRFQFQLETALGFRRQREQAERARLEDLASRKAALESQLRLARMEIAESRANLMAQTAITAGELASLDAFSLALEDRQRRIREGIAQLDTAIGEQRKVLIEATRQTRLLEKLRTRKKAQWQAEFDREIDNEAGELHLGKWIEQRGD